MTVSQNGWPASADRAAIGVDVNFTVAGVSFPGGVKAGDVSVVLRAIAQHWNDHVERLQAGWCWGHNYRSILGSNTVSNHGSATAIDCNAPRHPQGIRGTLSVPQVGEVRTALALVQHVVRWGGDFGGSSVDEMHFEINADAGAVRHAADILRGSPTPSPQPSGRATIKQGSTGDAVRQLQHTLSKWYPALPALAEDGIFGAKTTDRVKYFQGRAGLVVDGIVGSRTWSALGF